MTWLDINLRLASYTKLKPNWDSYGAEPPTLETIGMATRWASFLEMCGAEIPVNVAAIGNGIEFEWPENVLDFFNDGRVVAEHEDGDEWIIVPAKRSA